MKEGDKKKILIMGHGSAKIVEALEQTAKQNNMEIENVSDMVEYCGNPTAKLFQDYGHFEPIDINLRSIKEVPFYYNVPIKKKKKKK